MKQNLLLPDDLPPGPGFIEDWARRNRLFPVAGADEAGRGCLAGPVTAAAVILADCHTITGLDDSKTISEKGRELLYDAVISAAAGWGVFSLPPERIDETNILAAALECMREAVHMAAEMAGILPAIVIIDGNQPVPGLKFEQRPWPKADHLSVNCAAASIIAKVTRDRFMAEMDAVYPGYGFAVHKGYGTARHMKALAELGPCPIHRRTFQPVRSEIEKRR